MRTQLNVFTVPSLSSRLWSWVPMMHQAELPQSPSWPPQVTPWRCFTLWRFYIPSPTKRAAAAQGSGQMLGRGHGSLCPPAETCSKYVSVIPAGPVGWGGAGRAAGRAMRLGREGWVLGPLPTGPACVGVLSRGRGHSGARGRGHTRPFLGSPRWAEPGGSWVRSAPVGSLLDSSTQRDRTCLSSWAMIHLQGDQSTHTTSDVRTGSLFHP